MIFFLSWPKADRSQSTMKHPRRLASALCINNSFPVWSLDLPPTCLTLPLLCHAHHTRPLIITAALTVTVLLIIVHDVDAQAHDRQTLAHATRVQVSAPHAHPLAHHRVLVRRSTIVRRPPEREHRDTRHHHHKSHFREQCQCTLRDEWCYTHARERRRCRRRPPPGKLQIYGL